MIILKDAVDQAIQNAHIRSFPNQHHNAEGCRCRNVQLLKQMYVNTHKHLCIYFTIISAISIVYEAKKNDINNTLRAYQPDPCVYWDQGSV